MSRLKIKGIICTSCGTACPGVLKNPEQPFKCLHCRDVDAQRDASNGARWFIISAVMIGIILVIITEVIS